MRLLLKHDDGTGQIYLNGVLEATSSVTQHTPMDSLRIGINRRDELQWKGYIDEFKIYKRALTAIEVENLYNSDTPSSASDTSWTKALDFDGSTSSSTGDYAKLNNTWKGQNPLHRTQSSIAPGDSVPSGQTAASGQPWAVASVFRATDLSTSGPSGANQEFRRQEEMSDLTIISELESTTMVVFLSTLDTSTTTSNGHQQIASFQHGLYVDFNGGSTGTVSGSINSYYSRFRFKLVDLSTGAVTDVTSGGAWTHNNYGIGNEDVSGYFYVGSYDTESSNRFQGQIASTVITTLRTGQSLPGDTEVAMIVRDPVKWMTTYKIGNPWRKPNENADYSSNFAMGSATGEQGTKIWLMGDGTSDSSSNIASQVNSSNSGQYLQLNSASSTSVSIPGI